VLSNKGEDCGSASAPAADNSKDEELTDPAAAAAAGTPRGTPAASGVEDCMGGEELEHPAAAGGIVGDGRAVGTETELRVDMG
jgi:hypothetical protein